jgi:hypothetical protein
MFHHDLWFFGARYAGILLAIRGNLHDAEFMKEARSE